MHSDVDSLKSSLKQGDLSFDIMSNSDKSNSNADANTIHMKLVIGQQQSGGTSGPPDRDYILCRKMQKIMDKIG